VPRFAAFDANATLAAEMSHVDMHDDVRMMTIA
jgi:hypothetical protein